MALLPSEIPVHLTRICVEYGAAEAGTTYAIPFEYLKREHIYVQNKNTEEIYSYYLDRDATGNDPKEFISDQTDSANIINKFEWISDGELMAKEAITTPFAIFRYTPRDKVYRIFSPNTNLTADEFNEVFTALLYTVQEGENATAIVDELVNLGHLSAEVRNRLLPEAPAEGDRDGKILEYKGNLRQWVHAQSSATKYTPTQALLYPVIKDMFEAGTGMQIRQLDAPANRLLFNVLNHRYVPTQQELFPRFETTLIAGDNVTFDKDNSDHTITINAEGGSSEGGGSSALDEQLGTRVHLLEGYSYLGSAGIQKGQFTVHENGDIAIAVKDGQSIPEDFRAAGTFIQFNETVWQIMQEVLPQSGATRTFRVRKTIDSPIFPTNGNISFTRGIQRRVLTLENRVDVTENNHFDPSSENLYEGTSDIIQAGIGIRIDEDATNHTLTLVNTGGSGSSSDLEGVINPATISITAPTSSFTVEPGATRALEITGTTNGGDYVEKTRNAATVTLSKQATYRAFATVTVTNNENSSNGRVTPELIPTGANVTILEKVAPYVRTEGTNTYTVTTSTTFTTSAADSPVGFSIGNQVCLDDRRLLLTTLPNIRILPLIGATGPKGDKGDAGATFDENKRVRGQLSFLYGDGTTENISRIHPTQLQRIFSPTSGPGVVATDKRTDVRFLVSGFIPDFTALSQLVHFNVDGQPARVRTTALEKGEYINGNLFYNGVKVSGAFALIGTLSNSQLDNLIANSTEASFDIRYRPAGAAVDSIWSLRIPSLSATEATANPPVPHIPIENVKRGIDIDQVAFSARTITGTSSGGNVTVPLRLDLNSGKTKAATTSLVIPVGSSSGGGATNVARLPTSVDSIPTGSLYYQAGNGNVAGTRAPGLYIRHADPAWINICKTKVRLGTFSKTAALNVGPFESTSILIPEMDDNDCLVFDFTGRGWHSPVEFCVPWYRFNVVRRVTVGTTSNTANRIQIADASDDFPYIHFGLTTGRLLLISTGANNVTNSNLVVSRN